MYGSGGPGGGSGGPGGGSTASSTTASSTAASSTTASCPFKAPPGEFFFPDVSSREELLLNQPGLQGLYEDPWKLLRSSFEAPYKEAKTHWKELMGERHVPKRQGHVRDVQEQLQDHF